MQITIAIYTYVGLLAYSYIGYDDNIFCYRLLEQQAGPRRQKYFFTCMLCQSLSLNMFIMFSLLQNKTHTKKDFLKSHVERNNICNCPGTYININPNLLNNLINQ